MKQTRRGNSWSLHLYMQVILHKPILQHFQAKLWQSQWWIGNYKLKLSRALHLLTVTFQLILPCVDITASVDDEPPTKKRKIFDAEKIIIGEELSDIEINYAQRLLKEKHPNVGGLRTTLYKGKIPEVEDSVQIVHCSARHHWITVSTINCKKGEVRVFDSLFADCDKETEAVIHSLYQCDTEKIKIIMSRCQKQSGKRIAVCLQ